MQNDRLEQIAHRQRRSSIRDLVFVFFACSMFLWMTSSLVVASRSLAAPQISSPAGEPSEGEATLCAITELPVLQAQDLLQC